MVCVVVAFDGDVTTVVSNGRMERPLVTARSHERTTGLVQTLHRQSESRPATRTEARLATLGSHKVASWPKSEDQTQRSSPQALHLPAQRSRAGGRREEASLRQRWKPQLRKI